MEPLERNELTQILQGLLGSDAQRAVSSIMETKSKCEENMENHQLEAISDGQQVVVLGMHRSGTSALTGLLNKMGLFVGDDEDLLQPAEDNEKGYYERKDIVKLNAMILQSQGVTWKYQCEEFNNEKITDDEWKRIAPRIRAVISQLQAHKPWVVKDPRMCLTFPLWRRIVQQPVVILMHRHPEAVARSLAKRNELSLEEGFALWKTYSLAALQHSLALPRVSLTYEELLEDPQRTCRRLANELVKLGIRVTVPPPEVIHELVDPKLNHSGGNRSQGNVPTPQWDLWEALQDGRALDWNAEEIIQHN